MITRFFKVLFYCCLVFFMVQCSNDQIQSFDASDYDGFQSVKMVDEFSIKLPEYFIEMDDIDERAQLQYGYIEKGASDGVHEFNDEIYMTIIEFDKSQTREKIGDTTPVNLTDLNRIHQINLGLTLSDFEVVNESVNTEMINGMSCIKNQFYGHMGDYRLYYHMALFETEKRFYQILIWCYADYFEKHDQEMHKIIHAFERYKV